MYEFLDFTKHILSGALTIALGSFFAIHVFYKKKAWERREQAYQEIISALYDIVQYCVIKKEDYGNEDSYRDRREAELIPDYLDALAVIKKATDTGFLYVSRKAFEVLLELRHTKMLNPMEEPSFEVYSAEHEKYKKAFDSLMDIAKKELRST